MPTRSRREEASRAEARRRARYRQAGREATEATDAESEPSPAPAGGGFLTRLFPPVPPLPNRPDPLANFRYRGPLQGIVSGLYLLARHPRAWVVPGAIWGVGELLVQLGVPNPFLSTIASLVAFGALIGAGWIGWERPWAFGMAAATLGVVLFITMLAGAVAVHGTKPRDTTIPEFVVFLFTRETFQIFFGIVAGWYGGYLRRRLASAPRTRSRRR